MLRPRDGVSSSRIVVTGIGLRTALGVSREATWAALLAGKSGARRLGERFDRAGPEFTGYPIAFGNRRSAAQVVKAARDAIVAARLGPGGVIDRAQIATILGLSKGDLGQLGHWHRRQLAGGPAAARPVWSAAPGGAAARVAALWDLRGPCLAPVAACATGLVAVLRAFDLLRRDECAIALAGAGDASLDPLVLGAFRRMGVLARLGPNDDPADAVRPLDRRRCGFLPGEGAAVLVLERLDHALARSAPIYAEVRGGAMGSDAYHITNLDPDPAALAAVVKHALDRSKVAPDEIDHVNLHATATRTNDRLECRALQAVLSAHAASVLATANKAQIGHTLGAAGAVELALTCLAIRDAVVPPTLNRDQPDPECALATTPVARSLPVRAALKLSLGFGGHLAAVVLKRFEP